MVQATGCLVQPSFSSFWIYSAKAQLWIAGAAATAAAAAPPFINVLLETERSTILLHIILVLLSFGVLLQVSSFPNFTPFTIPNKLDIQPKPFIYRIIG